MISILIYIFFLIQEICHCCPLKILSLFEDKKRTRITCIGLYLLLTGTEGLGKSVSTELKIIPQSLSTQPEGEPPDWASGLRELVAQGIEIQSVVHSKVKAPTDPSEPVILNDMGSGIFTAKVFKGYGLQA